jgi:hypothetical protein
MHCKEHKLLQVQSEAAAAMTGDILSKNLHKIHSARSRQSMKRPEGAWEQRFKNRNMK